MSGRARRSWRQRAVITVNILGIAAALSLAWLLRTGEVVASSVNRVELSGSLTPVEPTDSGAAAPINVLLVGYDSAANLDPDDPITIGRQGERLGDVIIVARIDQETGTARLLSIPRDLWVSVPGFDDQKINGSFQLGGPALLIDTIETNLDIPINNFVSVDLAGFEGLVDVVDHVDVFFRYPSRDFNPSPPSGPPRSMSGFGVDAAGCASLEPPMALAFVRSRNFQVNIDGEWVDDGQRSDLERIRRQQIFLQSFVDRAIDLGARNPLVLRELVTEAVPHVTLDQELTPQTLIDLSRAFDSFDSSQLETYSLPTEFGWERNRTISVVRTLDEEAEPVLDLLRGVDPAEPSTVGVTIETAADPLADAEVLTDAFESAGFGVRPPVQTGGNDAGVVVRFGRDGETALPLVLAQLEAVGVPADAVELDATLPGREIVVRIGAQPVEPPTGTPTTEPAPESGSTTVPETTAPEVTSSSTVPGSTVPSDAGDASDPADSGPTVQSCP